MTERSELAVVTATRAEALAMRFGRGHPAVLRVADDAAKASVCARRLRREIPNGPIALVGIARGVYPATRHGDLVVATEVRGPGNQPPLKVPSAPLVATLLRRAGFTVYVGPLLTAAQPPSSEELANIAAGADTNGVVAVGCEPIARQLLATGRPFAVVRAIANSDTDPLIPWRNIIGEVRALQVLRRAMPALARWAGSCADRRLVLASPRSFCAGVERAITTVEAALAKHGPPVYVRRQIVHNTYVVRDLESKGAVFVPELDQVPNGATVVLAAHGVSPSVRDEATRRGLDVIDATCPLVAKVHHEAQRYAAGGYQVVLVGHPDHEEVQGTIGHAPEAITVVDDASAIGDLDIADPGRVAWLSQTTLATDETAHVVAALQARFPVIAGPRTADICYATQNRQDAVRAIAPDCDLVLVVGSLNSSNANRLVEVARRHGCRAHLLEDDNQLDPMWLIDTRTIGLTAAASTPATLVEGVISALASLGHLEISNHRVADEDVQFPLPAAVRPRTPED